VPSSSIYVGTDVACAVGKRLPICVVSTGRPPMPLTIPKHLAGLMPRGVGNREITAAAPFQEAAGGVVSTINRIVGEMGWQVERIAVDAPAAPPATGSRASENELGRLGLSSFRTPAASTWVEIREKCANHLRLGGSAATLPYANKIWMCFGFELFACLKSGVRAEVIEVYPFAIVRALLAARTGWEPQNLEARLKATVPGRRHDRLDAFMAAWIATAARRAARVRRRPAA
jgi:predicted nuclease with RNAse H fold